MIRLYVIEDNLPIIIPGLKSLFRPERDGIEVSGSSSNVDEAIEKAEPASFDLFVLDLYIHGFLPMENFRKLKEHFPGKPIAIYTSEKSSAWKKRMMDEGANTYVTKDLKRSDLKLAFTKAANGELFYFGTKEPCEDDQNIENVVSELNNLTPIEQDIIKLLAEELKHTEIAERIGISRSMVEKTLKRLRKDKGVKTNIMLINLYMGSGLI